MKNLIKKIAVMTSGGDAPGMNAAIRSVLRTALAHDLEVWSVHGGFEGLIDGNFSEMDSFSVSNIIQRGGTIIKTSRSERFKTQEGRKAAYYQLTKSGIDGLVIIGGNGSFAGAHAFCSEFPIPVIGVPKTIDNDVYGCDYTIGFDTACNTALEAIDKIRDTADAHNRLFFVEVMGRDAGHIALQCGLAAGAEAILIPEDKNSISDLTACLEKGWKRNKSSLIVVVAEGAVKGGVMALAAELEDRFKHYEIRTAVLGHIQRGGNPSCFDRTLASLLGNEAVKEMMQGKTGFVVGVSNNRLMYTPFLKAATGRKKINKRFVNIIKELSS
ncbi:6-phosphofructokinase [Sphingobacteriaceae bacterium]|nr:6-phosphofructokinase [Sphingobacteriaceae bacterium]